MKLDEVYKRFVSATTYGEFLVLLPSCSEEHTMELMARLDQAQKPSMLCGKEVPADLNTITYGQLDDLSRISEKEDPAARSAKILLGIEPLELYQLNVFDVFGFVNFVRSELNRINKLFASVNVNYSSEEIAAGVKELNFGTFGVIDWYARRMGITNQDEVYDVAWIRVYTCMKNDNAKSEYEARLHKQYMKRSKVK
jgi:hypothetical protein